MSEQNRCAAVDGRPENGGNGAPRRPEKEKKQNRTAILLALLVILLLGLIAGGLWYFLVYSARSPLDRETEALAGMLEGKTAAQQQDILNQKMQEGMVLLGISGEPVFEYNGKNGRIGLENDAGNQYSFKVTLTEDATGDVLYESGLIDPGYYVEYISLDKTLPAGDYPATAAFTSYSLSESPDPLTTTQIEITLHVMDGAFYQ